MIEGSYNILSLFKVIRNVPSSQSLYTGALVGSSVGSRLIGQGGMLVGLLVNRLTGVAAAARQSAITIQQKVVLSLTEQWIMDFVVSNHV